MSFTDKKREEIKKYILRKIAVDDVDVISKTMDNFGISVTSVKRYLQEAIKCEVIAEDKNRESGYQLVEHSSSAKVALDASAVEEDRLFQEYIAKHLGFFKPCSNIWQRTDGVIPA